MVDFIVLQAAGGDSNPAPMLTNYALLMVTIIVIWFFFLRPSAKKQKLQTKFIDEIQKGDEVVTNSGILGKVNKIDGSIVTLQVDTKTFIRVTKSSISRELTENVKKADNE
ncbi:MAG: preprotein translocase subunit YajC [Saprospiraceae bacterium]|nr:preprotein translocase subunit YajC [Saprospiraceae bacterium]